MGGSVSNHAVSFHFSETETSLSRPSFLRLPREELYQASGPGVDLVANHMLQPLVVRWPKENHAVKLPSRVSIVHHLASPHLIATLVQLVTDLLHRDFGKRCRVSLLAKASAELTHQALDQVTDGHSRRNSMGVHYNIRSDSFSREGHVLLVVCHPNRTLLPVSASKLVPDFGNSDGTHPQLHELPTLVVCRDHHRIDHASLVGLYRSAAILLLKP
mmetsp:Transcript_14281/g.27527  ORF Transcript_14281/g.27527 Transcript_14281/m.27527 type:complete len:216 (+) Transcript_14281:230-877(+)